jgi:hypothetical protein
MHFLKRNQEKEALILNKNYNFKRCNNERHPIPPLSNQRKYERAAAISSPSQLLLLP